MGRVLSSLTKTIYSISGIDFSALKIPLQRCGNIYKDFEKEILKYSSRSTGSRTSFRDWAKLRYIREDIDRFRRSLVRYKLTINITLINAYL